jgi:peptide/nickel transport system substrate-binding protein
MLATPALCIVSPTAAEKMGLDFAKHPIGTGPFKVEKYLPEETLILVRNSDYNWGPEFFENQGPPSLEKLEWRIIPEGGTRMSTLDTGETDVIEYMVPAAVQRYKSDPGFKVDLVNAPGAPRMAMLNTQNPPLDDAKVRKAIAYGIDRKAIVNTLYQGVYELAYGPLEPATFGYTSEVEKYYPHDIKKAKSLLEEAGWKDTDGDGIRDKNGQPLHLLFINVADDQFDEIAQMMQAQAREVGINIEIQYESSPTVWDTYMQGKNLHIGEIFWWNNDPQTLYSIWHSSQIGPGWNISRYNNPEVDKLIEKSLTQGDLQKRAALVRKIQIDIMEDAPFVPIHGKRSVMAYKSTLKGFKYDSSAIPYLYGLHWEK